MHMKLRTIYKKNPVYSHIGSNGSSLCDRIERHDQPIHDATIKERCTNGYWVTTKEWTGTLLCKLRLKRK